jgi:hypothetical protein
MGVPAPNLVGETFERLTVIAMVPPAPLPPGADPDARRGHWHCRCRCECGEQTTVRIDHLRRGKIRSCGCLMRLDLRGQCIGALTVLEPTKPVLVGKSAMTAWRCRCACGRVVTLATYRLTRPDHATHCGCRSEAARGPFLEHAAIDDLPEKTTSSAEWLKRQHDNGSAIGAVRIVGRSVEDDDDDSHCLTDFDPWRTDGD